MKKTKKKNKFLQAMFNSNTFLYALLLFFISITICIFGDYHIEGGLWLHHIPEIIGFFVIGIFFGEYSSSVIPVVFAWLVNGFFGSFLVSLRTLQIPFSLILTMALTIELPMFVGFFSTKVFELYKKEGLKNE